MSERHILYLTSTRAVLFRWAGARLSAEGSFPATEEGAAAFSQHIADRRIGLFYLLADVVEEDFHHDTIPFVRGADRRALLERKLAQRYRDTSLSLVLSTGTEKTQRRDERLLFSSFTNTQQFQPWLAAVRERELAVAGVYSVALVAGSLAAALGQKKGPCLLVTLEEAGLRQSYVEGGRLRFSRLGPLDAASATNPDRVAEAFDRETTRVYQYLAAMRVLPKDGGPLETVLVAPPGQYERIVAATPRVAQLKVSVVEFETAVRATGLRGMPEGMGAEALYLHLLARRAPRDQYARENLRGSFRIWQWRNALLAGGATLFVGCLIYAGLNVARIHSVNEEIRADHEQSRAAAARYAGMTSNFPAMPTTTENLRTTMQNYGTVVKQTRSPSRLLADLSRAVTASPRIELESASWENAASLRKVKPAAATPTPVPGLAPSAATRYEVVELWAKVLGTRANDYRLTMQLVNDFLDQLRKQPGVEVISTELPFDIGSQKTLSGDVGVEQRTEEPRFKVVVARRVTP
jgi:hypothetical protein